MPLPQDPRNPRLGPDILGKNPVNPMSNVFPTPKSEETQLSLPHELFLCRYSLSHNITKDDARYCGMIKNGICGVDEKPCQVFRFLKSDEPPIVTRDID